MENYINQNAVPKVKENFLSKVYLYFGLALILTGIVAICLSYIFESIFPISNPNNMMIYYSITTVSSIALVIMTFVLSFKSSSSGKSSLVLFIIYSLLWGIMLSSLLFVVGDPMILGLTFIISAFLFLAMSLIGYFAKGSKIAIISSFIVGLSIIIGCLFLVNMVIIPFTFIGGEGTLNAYINIYRIIEGIFLAMMLLMTIVDTYRIRKISEAGSEANNLVVYCAFSLYLDFIYIFIYVLKFLILIVGSNRN